MLEKITYLNFHLGLEYFIYVFLSIHVPIKNKNSAHTFWCHITRGRPKIRIRFRPNIRVSPKICFWRKFGQTEARRNYLHSKILAFFRHFAMLLIDVSCIGSNDTLFFAMNFNVYNLSVMTDSTRSWNYKANSVFITKHKRLFSRVP